VAPNHDAPSFEGRTVEDVDVLWRLCFDAKIEHLIEIAIV
jgi:hypothetical protein